MSEKKINMFGALDIVGRRALKAAVQVTSVVDRVGGISVDTLAGHEHLSKFGVEEVTLLDRQLGTGKN